MMLYVYQMHNNCRESFPFLELELELVGGNLVFADDVGDDFLVVCVSLGSSILLCPKSIVIFLIFINCKSSTTNQNRVLGG